MRFLKDWQLAFLAIILIILAFITGCNGKAKHAKNMPPAPTVYKFENDSAFRHRLP